MKDGIKNASFCRLPQPGVLPIKYIEEPFFTPWQMCVKHLIRGMFVRALRMLLASSKTHTCRH